MNSLFLTKPAWRPYVVPVDLRKPFRAQLNLPLFDLIWDMVCFSHCG